MLDEVVNVLAIITFIYVAFEHFRPKREPYVVVGRCMSPNDYMPRLNAGWRHPVLSKNATDSNKGACHQGEVNIATSALDARCLNNKINEALDDSLMGAFTKEDADRLMSPAKRSDAQHRAPTEINIANADSAFTYDVQFLTALLNWRMQDTSTPFRYGCFEYTKCHPYRADIRVGTICLSKTLSVIY